jgi:hypothetical protein
MRKFMLADFACLALSGCMSAEETAAEGGSRCLIQRLPSLKGRSVFMKSAACRCGET